MVFGNPWATLGASGRPLGLHLSPSGIHSGASGASIGSICRMWGSIEAPLRVIGGHFYGHFAIISGKEEKMFFLIEKTQKTRYHCELDPSFVDPNGLL